MERTTTVDAVVIGAGHNGLVAANLLADAGWDVVVCEAADTAGGAVRSTRELHPDFTTDLYSAFYPLGYASPVLRRLDLAAYGLRWSHSPSVLAHVFPDDRCAVLSRDLSETARNLDAFAAGDGDSWIRLTEQWNRIGSSVLSALFQPFPPIRPAAGLLRRAGLGDSLRLARLALSTVRRFGEENFAGAGGPILLAGNALHADLSPDSAGSAVYGWLLAMLGQAVGFPVPVGGAARLIDALVLRLEARGGQVRLSSPVESVGVRHGAATGVRLAGGAGIRARRAVLADVAAPILYQRLLRPADLSPAFRAELAHFQWDPPTLKLDWALNGPIPWIAAGARGAGTVHLGVDLAGLSWYAASLATGTAPQAPFVLLGQMTTSDATRSPAGTESAWAYTHLPPELANSADAVAEQVRRVQALVERHAPGFGELITSRLVQSPAALQEANPNLVNGAVNGGTAQLHQQLVFRPVAGLGGADTPIDRLYLAGSSAHPGGGVHGAAGSNAAITALRRDAWYGGLRRKGVRAVFDRIY
jgi:phytoene dehydrogenase-like protein